MSRLYFKKRAKFCNNLATTGVLISLIGLCMVGCSIILGKDIAQMTAEHYEDEIDELCRVYNI